MEKGVTGHPEWAACREASLGELHAHTSLGFKWMSRSLPGEEGFWAKWRSETACCRGTVVSLGMLKDKVKVG